ncbi:MAG TPA: tetratricopeptide repeat protein, partial [Steroidobacteraceae bacterium]|nr:tetratricopeptide repeat protein [Steroidobacteraceae bacterium]
MVSLTPLLLLLAFGVVATAAWLLGRRSAKARAVRLPRDYYLGLDHLINDRFDRATEVFARMAERDGDAAEIQFALGSLFRRRGEVDRAIAIHTRLKEAGAPAVREEAAYALALDHMSAGLMDSAERLLEEIAESRQYRSAALGQLVRLYEQQGDWANALRVHQQLGPPEREARRRAAAHYLCELAEHALSHGEPDRASELAAQAHAQEPDLPRAELLAARIAERAGDAATARARYLDVLARSPQLALEIVPRVLGLPAGESRTQALDELATQLARRAGMSPRQVAWLLVTAVPPEDADAAGRLADRLFGAGAGGEAQALGAVLARIGDAGGRYSCGECGLASARWYWHCPKCREWDCLEPAVF